MSESGLASIGSLLRETRESRGLSLDAAAMRLRLMHRQVEAMETEDFDSLGPPVFARGFVRNYARLLGLAPEPLLARMPGAPTEAAVTHPVETPPAGSWLTSPWLILIALGLLAVVVVPVGLYWWLNSDVAELASARPPAATRLAGPSPAADEGVGATMPVVETMTEAGADDAAPASPDVPADVDGSVLHLEFAGESWVEVRDAGGRILHRQLNPPGSEADIRGRPPFDLIIGNAAQVRMTHNDRPIDLAPFIDTTVARFSLEE